MKLKVSKSKRIISLLTVLFLMAGMVFSNVAQVSAVTTASDKVDAVKESILQVRMLYKPDKNGIGVYFSGTSFLINDNTIITCAHIFDGSDDKSEEYLREKFGQNHVFDEKNIKTYEVVVNGGLTVPATIRKINKSADYAILTLNETVKRPTVTLGNSGEVKRTQTVYTLGFPSSIANLQDSKTYSTDQVTITDSTIANLTTTGGIDYIEHNAKISEGNSGGPLVDENGSVVGVNLYTLDGYFMSAAIDQIKSALDDLDIKYENVSSDTSSEEETTVADDTDNDKEAGAATKATETEETEPIIEPESGFDMTKIIIIAAIVILLIIVVVVVILIILSSKKKSSKTANIAPNGPTVSNGAVKSQYIPSPNAKEARPMTPPYNKPAGIPTVMSNEGAAETSVLNDGAGETTVLGASATGFSLIRKRNNEKIIINKPEFFIGKERRRVDYCVSDNNSISRQHAKIKVRGGRCYITDLNSTNCTYVNGTRISPNQEVILSKGDSIKISDEEFEFLG